MVLRIGVGGGVRSTVTNEGVLEAGEDTGEISKFLV